MPDTARHELDPQGKWITTAGGKHVHVDGDGDVDAGGWPGVQIGSPVYNGYAPGELRDSNMPDKMPAKLRRHADEWVLSLTGEEMKRIYQYTVRGHIYTNKALKSCPDRLDCLDVRSHRIVTAVQSAIRKAGPLPRPVIAYRGFQGSPERQEQLIKAAEDALASGGTVRLPGFASMSLDPVVSSIFSKRTRDANGYHSMRSGNGVVFEVRCHSGAPVGLTNELSAFGDKEQEILHNHNTGYKVTAIERDVPFANGSAPHAKHTVIHLEQLDNGQESTVPTPYAKGVKGWAQAAKANALDLMGFSDVELPAGVFISCPGLVVFADLPVDAVADAVASKKPGKKFGKKSGKGGDDQQPPADGSEADGQVSGPVAGGNGHADDEGAGPHLLEAHHKVGKDGKVVASADEQKVRDAHAKIGEHLTRRAMAGQWGPAEAGLQKMHQHLSDALAKHEGERTQKDMENQAVGIHNAHAQAHSDHQEALKQEAAQPKEPDVKPAEKLAIENRKKRAEAKAAKAQKAVEAAGNLTDKDGNAVPGKSKDEAEEDKHLPPSVAASKRLAAGAPMLPKKEDAQKPGDKSDGKPGDKANPFAKKGDDGKPVPPPDAAGGKPNPFAKNDANKPGGGPGATPAPEAKGGDGSQPPASPPGGAAPGAKTNPFAKKGSPPPAPAGDAKSPPPAAPAAGAPGAAPGAPPGAAPSPPAAAGAKPSPFAKKPAPGAPAGAPAGAPPAAGGPPAKPGQPAPAAPPGSPPAPGDSPPTADGDAPPGAPATDDPQAQSGPSPEVLAEEEERKKGIKPPSTEEQANAVLSYKVKLRVATDDRGDLTTNTNTGGHYSKAEKKLREALDELANPAKGRYLHDRKELASVVRKAIGRPATTGELDVADPRRSGKIAIRPDGSLVRESKEGVWYCPDKFAPPEFVPASGGTMPGGGPAIEDEKPPLSEAVHIHAGDFKGQRFFVPIGLEGEPLTHQHFCDKHTAKIVGQAKLAKCDRAKLSFDATSDEWVISEHHLGGGWKEVKRYPKKEEDRAERHLRLALEKHLAKAGHDIGRPGEEPPIHPHSVSSLHMGGQVLHHAVSPDGSPIGEFHHDRETAVLYAKAVSKGVLESRLRRDGDQIVLEKSSPDAPGWRKVRSFKENKPHAAERSFRKALRDDLERAESRPLDEKAVSGDDMDQMIADGHKRAKNIRQHAGKKNEVAPAIMRHAGGVVQGAFAKLSARHGKVAASAIAATGFKHASHGMGLSRPGGDNDDGKSGKGGKDRDAKFADDDAGTPDKKRPCNWITITGGPMCVGKGGRILLGPNHLKGRSAKDVITHEADKGRVKAASDAHADPEKGWAKKMKHSHPSGGVKAGAGAAGSRGMSGGGFKGGGGGHSSHSGGGGGHKKAFGSGAVLSIAALWKKMMTGSATDTTGHGNTAVNRPGSWTSLATPGAMAGPANFAGSDVTFTPTNPRHPKLSKGHIKVLGRLFMEEVRAAMTKAQMTRKDLHAAQDSHDTGKGEGWVAGDGKGRVKSKGLRGLSDRQSSEMQHHERHDDKKNYDPSAFAAFGRNFSLAGRIRTREGTIPEKDAIEIVCKLETILSEILLRHTRIRHLEIYQDRVGTQKRADETQGDGVKGVKGFYDRSRELMVVSVVGADSHNFYHELAHSIDHLLTQEDWERVEEECGGRRPENFACAFADLCMALRAGHGAVRQFVAKYPAVAGIMHRYSVVENSHFAVDDTSRVFRVCESARLLTSSLRSLTEFSGRSYRELRDLLSSSVERAVAAFDGVFEGLDPSYVGVQSRIKLRDLVQVVTDYCDDVLYTHGKSGVGQARFSDEFNSALSEVVPAATWAIVDSLCVLPPKEVARELATAIAFGWQDQVRGEHGRWGPGSGHEGEPFPSRNENYFGDEATRAKVKELITAKPDPANLPPRDSLPTLPPPPHPSAGPKALDEWSAAVANHPYVKEAERLIKVARDSGATTGNLYWNPDAGDGKGDFTPERKAIHDDIAAHILNPDAATKPGDIPQISFVLGPPGSGKSSMGRPAAHAAMGLSPDRVTTLDPDEVKMSLPEYRGWNATLVHDESAEVFDRILEKAVRGRHNVCFDTTGRDLKFMKSMVDKFAGAGYDVHLVHTHLSGEASAQRAVTRFVRTAFQDSPDPEQRGRYVPVGFIAKNIDGNPERVYDQLRQDDHVRSWVSYDATNLSQGIIRNSGTRPSMAVASGAAA